MKRKLRLLLYLTTFMAMFFCVNWVIQVYRNPAILISLFGGNSFKSSRTTWQDYRHLFKRHATAIIIPEFLSAMAQAESAGNPLTIPQWQWRFTSDLTRIYAPASSSAGLYQYTRATFKDAKRFCIHNHEVALKKNFPNLTGCWFNDFYSRFWPSHAIEMTSARLHYYVNLILRKYHLEGVRLLEMQKLAAVIHLCGVTRGDRFAREGFDFKKVSLCGSHSTASYFNRIQSAMDKIDSRPGRFFERFF